VPGEVRLRRGEPELGRALGQHLVQRCQPGYQGLGGPDAPGSGASPAPAAVESPMTTT
jgi:hypothetical protein